MLLALAFHARNSNRLLSLLDRRCPHPCEYSTRAVRICYTPFRRSGYFANKEALL